MMQATIFLNREDAAKTEQEERTLWVKDILLKIGIPLDDIWPENNEFTVEDKIKFRKLMAKYDILILDDSDHGLEIYVDDDIIARWNKPIYKLRIDNKQVDPAKKMFLEMNIDAVSIFDNDDEELSEETEED